MKIQRISKIDNFSIFKNFDWNQHLSLGNNQTYDFKDINIFYGRNYSGKTSLSKIIRALDTKTISTKYDNPDFKVELSDNSIISQNNLTTFTHPIHVYNSDFVKENLKFIHDENANIESFSVTLGGDNQLIINRIQELKSELGSNEENAESQLYLAVKNKSLEVKGAEQTHTRIKEVLNDLLKDKASGKSDSIRSQPNLYGDQDYNIGKLNRTDIPSVLNPTYQPLSDEKELELRNILNQQKLSNSLEIPTFTLNFSTLCNSVDEILKIIVGGSHKIDELVSDPSLNSWVQTGHDLHKDRTHCAFCTHEITDKRRQELAQHFDQETQNLQSRISKGIGQLTNLIDGKDFKIDFDINQYYQQYHTKLSSLENELTIALGKQKTSLEQLKALLVQKNGKLFTELKTEYPQDHSREIENIIQQIDAVRTQCIQQNDLLETQQKEAKTALRLNHVYHFLQYINYTQLNLDIALAFQAIAPLETELNALKNRRDAIITEIKSEEDKLKSEGEACIRINNILNHDFGHQALSLKAIDNQQAQNIQFEIQRNGTKAHNLSEGEQSLISFCYFLAKIQDDLDQGNKPIIWIDDPISSLDSNHIFFIFSLIEEKIVVDQKIGQLFISTHNLEFLKYLKRLNGKKWGNIQFYIIKRNFDSSAIVQMPNYMKNYFSELNFLFHQLHLCASEENINDQNYNVFYNFPNNARKFLELYSNFHYPDGFSNTDTEKLKSLWGEHLVFTFTDRINNEYSHLAGIFERSFTPLEQPEMNKASFAILKKIIVLNPRQYEGFLKSIGIESTALDPLYIKLTT